MHLIVCSNPRQRLPRIPRRADLQVLPRLRGPPSRTKIHSSTLTVAMPCSVAPSLNLTQSSLPVPRISSVLRMVVELSASRKTAESLLVRRYARTRHLHVGQSDEPLSRPRRLAGVRNCRSRTAALRRKLYPPNNLPGENRCCMQ